MAGLDWLKIKPNKAKELVDNNVQHQALRASDPLDGALVLDGMQFNSSNLAIESTFQNSSALINEYRDMNLDPDIDMAVDDIVNAIVTCDEDMKAVEIDFSRIDISDKMTEIISKEFDTILELMNFNINGYELVRQWYVDGRQFFQPILDKENPKAGIQKIVYLDARTIQKIKVVFKKTEIVNQKSVETIDRVEDIYAYNPYWAPEYNTAYGGIAFPALASVQTRQLNVNDIVYVHSGIKDPVTGVVVSDLEKAKKPLNNLKMMRDAQVLYRITRSVEKRVFKVDVGSLPPKQAAEQVNKVMKEHKTKLVYDPKSGKVNGTNHQQSMIEDFWLPVREGGRGSDVTTLAGAQNLNEIDDIIYFQKLMYRSVNVPEGRLDNDQPMLFGSKTTEINRGEWKFDKFIARKRRRYGSTFTQLLKIQLLSKGIVDQNEWDTIYEPNLMYEYASDSFIANKEETEEILDRIQALGGMEAVVGKYVSPEYIYEKVWRFTEEDIKREMKRIAETPKEFYMSTDEQYGIGEFSPQNNPGE